MRNGGSVLLALLNLYLQIKILVATFDTNRSVTDSTLTVNRCFSPEASLFCSQIIQSVLTVDIVCMSGETIRLAIGLRLSIDLLQVKGKAVPLQAWSGPEGSRKLRFSDLMTTAQDGGKVVSLTHRSPLPPGNTPGTHFC